MFRLRLFLNDDGDSLYNSRAINAARCAGDGVNGGGGERARAEGAGNALAEGVAVGSQVVTRVGICHPAY